MRNIPWKRQIFPLSIKQIKELTILYTQIVDNRIM